jgi:hypothetical protein
MRINYLLIALVVCVIFLAPSALPQVCGDANGNGTVNVSDWAMIMNYMATGSPIPGTTADCDNRSGITIGDAEAIVRYIFYGEDPLDCSIQSTYSFTSTLNDTVFLPYMLDIPDDLDSVVLPVITSFATDTRAFDISCQVSESNGPGLFELRRIDYGENLPGSFAAEFSHNNPVMLATEFYGTNHSFTGRHSYFELVFRRLSSGLAAIDCVEAALMNIWRVSVEKGGDLYLPVIQYYQVPLPHPIVTADPTPLAMEAKAGYWSTQTYPVTFSSDMVVVSFKLTASASWIAIDEPSSTVYATPATIIVHANASALAAGDYSGQITFTDITPADAEFVPSPLEVTLTVKPAIIYPPGDLNCNGMVTIGDVSLLIDCLFINTRPVPACE